MAGRRWTPDELAVVEDGYYARPVASIAKQLGRSVTAVYLKAEQLGLSRRDPSFLSANEVRLILGNDEHVVRRWIVAGELPGQRVPGRGRRGFEYQVREADLVAWLKANPWLVDRDAVEAAYRPYIAERYITLAEAFRRGAAHATALGQAAYAGLVPGQRRRGLFWVVPESVLPALIEARRMNVTDAEHRRQLMRYERTQRVYEIRRTARRKAA